MKTKIIISLLVFFLIASCATIVSGSKQKIKFDSTPTNAKIFIDNVEIGKTPFETKLKRNGNYKVKIQLDGYKAYEVNLKKKMNGWIWGNILIGGIVGYIVDVSTGAIYRLSPNDLKAVLAKDLACKKSENSNVYIYATLDVDKNWEKVGQLEVSE